VNIFNRIINLIYPPDCIFCRQILRYDAAVQICDTCYRDLPFSGEELLAASQEDGDHYCDGVVSVFEYTGVVKESLIRFKFYNEPGYYRTYAELIAEKLTRMVDVGQYHMLLSVPLHKHKEISRGYNQAYLISRELSRKLKLPERSRLIKRCRYTEAQSLLDKEKRSRNVKGAFAVISPDRIAGKSILLVDDILTTGSTLEECGRVLKNAGAAKITAVVVATGRKI